MNLSKKCLVCGKEFYKLPKYSYKQWDGRIFCSNECRSKNGCSEETIKKISDKSLGRKHTQKTKDKMSMNHADFSGENHPRWKGGKYQDKNGRWIIWVNGIRYVRARYIAMKCLGRELLSTEIIHHINEDKSDDRPENLYLFPFICKHISQHRTKNPPILVSNLIC